MFKFLNTFFRQKILIISITIASILTSSIYITWFEFKLFNNFENHLLD